MRKVKIWLPALLLAAGLAVSLPLGAFSQCGSGSMNHGNMGSSGMMGPGNMGPGNMGMGSSGNMGQGTMGPGMMGGANAPAGTWSQPAAPGNMGSGQMGNMGTMDHSQMGHGSPGTGQ